MKPAIRADGVWVRLDGQAILRGVSFEVQRGEFLTVVGANGAGKSTLLRVLDGLLLPSRGRVELAGRPVEAYTRRELARAVSFVPQMDTGPLPYEVRTFVEMGRYPHLGPWARPTGEDADAVDRALELTGTARLAGRQMSSLSGGELQLVLVAAALAQGGELLLLDEPTSFLDYRHQAEVVELLARLHADDGYTVLVASHDLNSAVAPCDAVLALKEGAVVFHGPPGEILAPERLRAIYDTEFELVPRDGGLPLVAPRRGG
jgi:iron complex transport system ATP-binding protein